ncbi:MAG: FadR family transcriptional regulator [Anaerolineae bacterium]|nr:FadR family transcriptional regulator [Anaerolineae bacterium]
MHSRFRALERRALADQIADRILQLILDGELQPGQKLPPERELAATLGVSRTSVREATKALAMRNIVEIRQGDGTYVTSLEPALLLEPLEFFVALSHSNFFHLFEVRKILEGSTAALAAERITDEEVAYLQECVHRAERAADDSEAYLQADLDLHNGIVRAARNPVLTRLMESIANLTWASRRRTVDLPGVKVHAPRDHRAIVDALRARDPERCRRMMLRHLEHIQHALEQAGRGHAQSELAPDTLAAESHTQEE